MHLAGSVADNQRRARICLSLSNSLQRLLHVGAHSNLCNINVAVGHRDFSQRLLADRLAGSRELRNCANRSCLGSLTAGVGVNLGIEYHDVDVLTGSQHVVKAAEADIVSPAVAAEDPDGLLSEVLLACKDFLAGRAAGSFALFELCNQCLGCFSIGVALILGFQEGVDGVLHGVGRVLCACHLFELGNQTLTNSQLAVVHTQTVLSIVLKQGVCPSRTVAVCINGVRRGSSRAAPDGRTAGCVGDIHTIATNLSDQASIRGLGTACAGAGELKQRLLELAVLDGIDRNHVRLLGNVSHHVVEHILLSGFLLLSDHGQRLGRADADAHATAHAVERRNSQRILVNALALAGLDVDNLSRCGSCSSFLLGQRKGTNGCVRANVRTLVTLHTGGLIPGRNGNGYAALLVSSCAVREGTVHIFLECGYRQAVAVHTADGIHQILDHLDGCGCAFQMLLVRCVCSVRPSGRNVNLDKRGSACVNCLVVHVNHILTLLEVGLGCSVLHELDRLLRGHYLCQRKERRLQDGVGALAHTDFNCKIDCIDGIQLNVVLSDITLGNSRHVVVKLFRCPLAVNQEYAARLYVAHHRVTLDDVGRVMAGNEVSLINIVRRADRLVTKTQMRNGYAAGLLGVVLEVSLYELIGMVADNLDGVLVCANGAVAAQTPELALGRALCRGVRRRFLLQ